MLSGAAGLVLLHQGDFFGYRGQGRGSGDDPVAQLLGASDPALQSLCMLRRCPSPCPFRCGFRRVHTN